MEINIYAFYFMSSLSFKAIALAVVLAICTYVYKRRNIQKQV
jgi:hypothetical protein